MMTKAMLTTCICALTLSGAVLKAAQAASSNAGPEQAKQILTAAGIKGGLIVHLGCGDGTLTAALRATDSYLVHGLDGDASNIEKARQYLQGLRLSGRVSVEQWKGTRLPYNDNLVNLVVAEDLGGVTMEEGLYLRLDEVERKWRTEFYLRLTARRT